MRRSTWHDAYDAQMGLWRWYRTAEGLAFLQEGYRINATPLGGETRKLLAALYGSEVNKVLAADPYFVSREMTDVIEAAAESFKPEALLPTDLLTSHGFVWYERPFRIIDRFGEPFDLCAFSWCPMLTGDVPDVNLTERNATDSGIAVSIYQASPHAPIGFAPAHMTPWWYGMSFDGNEEDENGKATGAEWWWKLAQTSLRLMQQRIAVSHRERPTRPQRREGQRLGFDAREDGREVVVVRLRREAGDHQESSGEDANYSHRFIVGGHWRNQWYPSAQTHRQIWISPYVKGPEDAPLVVKPRRAFTFDR